MTATTIAPAYYIELGVNGPDNYRELAVEAGPYPSLMEATFNAELLRGKTVAEALKHPLTDDARDPHLEDSRIIVGATVTYVTELNGTEWTQDLLEWEPADVIQH